MIQGNVGCGSPLVFWLTGLSGAGKSTIGALLERTLQERGLRAYLLDGDRLRRGLNRDLGYSKEDRAENVRRIAEVAKLMTEAGVIVIVAAISPFEAERRAARALFRDGAFVEVFVDTPLSVAERRDVKGLYARARAGELSDFTGIDSPYEAPTRPDIHIDTTLLSAEEAAKRIVAFAERGAAESKTR